MDVTDSVRNMRQQSNRPIGPEETIVFIGDSITRAPAGYVETVREILGHRFPQAPPEVINAGVDGNTVRQMLGRFDRDVLSHNPDWISIMAGVADTVLQMGNQEDTRPQAQGSEPQQFGEVVERMIRRAQQAGACVALCTPTDVEDDYSGDATEANRIIKQKTRELKRLAEDHDLPVIPTGSVLREARENAQGAGSELYFTPDGLHPNPKGHALLALTVLSAFGYTLRL